MTQIYHWEEEVAREFMARNSGVSFEDALTLVRHHRDEWRKMNGLERGDPGIKFQ